jgi:ABC-2 type transport system permease protein
VALTIATLAVSVTFSIALIRSRNGDVTVATPFWQTIAAGFVVMTAYGTIGVAIGALVRNQIAAVVGVLVWMFTVEQIVIPAFPAVGHWMPWRAAAALLQLGPAITLDGNLLPAAVGGLVLAGYTTAAVVLALRISPGRDVQ